MAVFNKFQCFAGDVGEGIHDLRAAGHTVMVYLTNNAPNAANHSIRADLPGITEQHGYAPEDITNDWANVAGVGTLTGVNVTWTAAGGAFGAFRYVVLYNDDPAGDPLIGWWDYGSSITVSAGESFTVDFGASVLTIT
jgi:hypothetical protein